MSFMAKKKRFKFQVTFEIEELSSVPLVSGMLFAKVRLMDGGSFTEFSTREEVCNHKVHWKAKYTFVCKMVASANTGVLETCICRVSVRKELKGGKSSQKLGYADINLAEFAGAGRTARKFLLEGYDPKRRQDNSMLLVYIDMALLSGDSLFKVPSKCKVQMLPGELQEEELQPENKGGDDYSTGSVASGSSGFGSLPRKPGGSSSDADLKVQDLPGPVMPVDAQQVQQHHQQQQQQQPLSSHSRNSSCTSQQSKVSGYSSTGGNHSRQSSCGETVHKRTASTGSGWSEGSKQSMMQTGSLGHTYRQHQSKKLEVSSSTERRLGSTRVDADELIDELIKNTDFQMDDSAETAGLQLFVGKDGKAVLGSQKTDQVSKYKQVIMDTR